MKKDVQKKLGLLFLNAGVALAAPLFLLKGYTGELIGIGLAITVFVSNHKLLEDEVEDLLGKLK